MPVVELQACPQPFWSSPFLSVTKKNMFSGEDKKDQGKLSKFQPTQALTSTGYRTIRVERKCTGVCVCVCVYQHLSTSGTSVSVSVWANYSWVPNIKDNLIKVPYFWLEIFWIYMLCGAGAVAVSVFWIESLAPRQKEKKSNSQGRNPLRQHQSTGFLSPWKTEPLHIMPQSCRWHGAVCTVNLVFFSLSCNIIIICNPFLINLVVYNKVQKY